MKTKNFVAIDFETATHKQMPCQLGLVVVRNGRIVEEKQWLIKPPGNEYHALHMCLHGIRPEDTESSPEFDELWDEIKSGQY
jgi:DNA polymerase-3 subunit epsilon